MKRLRVIQRPRCKGWYIRPSERGTPKWVLLSHNKDEAERLAREYYRQRMLKKVKGYNQEADIHLAADKYIKYKFATTVTTRKSQVRYSLVLRRFKEFVLEHGFDYISDLNRENVLDFLAARNESISSRTWNMERNILSNFFKYCLENKWIDANLVRGISAKEVADPEVEHLDSGEATRLLTFLNSRKYRVPYYEIIATILHTGMRVNEATHLRKRDVLADKWLFSIGMKSLDGVKWVPKTKQTRFVPIPEEIRPIIRKQMKTPGELLFSNTKGSILGDRHILARIQYACRKTGLKKVHTHSLRHTFCSIAHEKGIPETFIQQVLGHKSASMTRRYRHLRPEFLSDAFREFKYNKNENDAEN